jgi:hypothetical protein
MSGTLVIDVQINRIRIARRSGTTLPHVRDSYIQMCRDLGNQGRMDVLRALRDCTVSFADAWLRYQEGAPSPTPSPESVRLKPRKLYVVRADPSGNLKIGVTRDVDSRMSQLQTSTWEVLTLIACREGPMGAEFMAHEMFAEHRIRGEWFRPHLDILEWAVDFSWEAGLVRRLIREAKRRGEVATP